MTHSICLLVVEVMGPVWHRCTERFSQDAPALLRSFGYDEKILSSNARIHSNLRASNLTGTERSSGISSTKEASSLADDEYVRRVLYPWDTQLHEHICGDV